MSCNDFNTYCHDCGKFLYSIEGQKKFNFCHKLCVDCRYGFNSATKAWETTHNMEGKLVMEKNKKFEDKDIAEILMKCLDTLESKGKDYTLESKDKLHNFRTVAEFTGLTKEQVLSVYLYKHVAAIFNYCKSNKQSESEPIEGRIMDAINYLLLFYKMVKEGKK